MKKILIGFVNKKNFWPRFFIVLIAVLLMGISLSFLIQVNLGTDPCTLMNVSISDTIGMSLGNWQALLNLILMIIVFFFGADNIGFGTVFNMFLIGYTIDFCNWLWNRILPMEMFQLMSVRIAVLIPALSVFILSAALYMDVDMGTAPYDAVPYIVSQKLPKVSFRTIRIGFDFTVTVIGMLFGGIPGLVTALMVFTLGPVISWLGGWLARHFRLFRELN